MAWIQPDRVSRPIAPRGRRAQGCLRRRGRARGLYLWTVAVALTIGVFAPWAPADPPAATSASTPAATQPATRPSAPVDTTSIARSLAGLAADDPTAREAARSQLLELSPDDLPALAALLRHSTSLAPSQAAVLRSIVKEIYLAGQDYEKDPDNDGFLGVKPPAYPFLDTADLQQPTDDGHLRGVIVAGRVAGFCASRMLHDGDVLIGTIDPEQYFAGYRDLTNALTDMEAGSIVRFRVLRQGQVIQVPITLDWRPLNTEAPSIMVMEKERADKFDHYWRHTFAPLLDERVE